MTRKRSKANASPAVAPVVQNAAPDSAAAVVQNGLAGALGCGIGLGGGINPTGAPFGAIGGEQVSGANTLFKNLRWYYVSNFRQLLSEMYAEIGLVQVIVDVPVDDALRGGVTIKSKQLDEDQIEELQISLDRDDDLTTAGQAAKWNRLFGGAAIIIMTDQDPLTPLDMEALTEDDKIEFRAADMWELSQNLQNAPGGDDTSGQNYKPEFYTYYSERIHHSRVMRLKGFEAPSFIRPRLRGWGFSVVEVLVRALNQYLKATDLSFEVLDEFKLDVYKIKNLTSTLMSPIGQQAVAQRVQLGNWQKNYQNALVMDSEDDYDHKQLSFTGLAEVMTGIRIQIASELRMPLSKIFGLSSTGFNSGEDDIEVYNAMVESQVRSKLKYDILRILEIKCQVLFGFVPDDLSLAFQPLRVMSSEQEETVKTSKFARLLQAQTAGAISMFEFRDACNKGDLFDVTLDNAGDELNPDDPGVADIVADEPEPEETGDGDDAGPDKGAKKAKVTANADFKESEHPRADDGKFGEGGGGEKPGKSEKVKKPKKDPAVMSVGEIQKEYAALDKKSSANITKLCEAGFGTLKPDAMKKRIGENPLFAEYFAISGRQWELRSEAVARGGPGFTVRQLDRIHKPLKSQNSAAFDRASYEAAGGDSLIPDGKRPFFDHPKDKGLWEKAKERTGDAWKFTVWLYKKLGGVF